MSALQGSEISTPYSSVTSLSEDTLQYLDTHQHLLPGAKRPPSASSRSRVASLRHSVRSFTHISADSTASAVKSSGPQPRSLCGLGPWKHVNRAVHVSARVMRTGWQGLLSILCHTMLLSDLAKGRLWT